jgi:hypothetical protein
LKTFTECASTNTAFMSGDYFDCDGYLQRRMMLCDVVRASMEVCRCKFVEMSLKPEVEASDSVSQISGNVPSLQRTDYPPEMKNIDMSYSSLPNSGVLDGKVCASEVHPLSNVESAADHTPSRSPRSEVASPSASKLSARSHKKPPSHISNTSQRVAEKVHSLVGSVSSQVEKNSQLVLGPSGPIISHSHESEPDRPNNNHSNRSVHSVSTTRSGRESASSSSQASSCVVSSCSSSNVSVYQTKSLASQNSRPSSKTSAASAGRTEHLSVMI